LFVLRNERLFKKERAHFMDDRKITVLLIKGSQDGLKMLIQKYRGLVGAIISRILTGRDEDIEECISDTFISVWKHRKYLDPTYDTLKGFIACIAKRKAIDRYHKLSKEKTIPIGNEEFTADIDLSIQLERKCDNEIVQALICAMKMPDREIFIRRHYYMQPIREIASAMSMSKKQIKNRLYQSRIKLKDMLIKRGVSI
jgi:RNA polymerase sigma-70 factor (ECF subfamily)